MRTKVLSICISLVMVVTLIPSYSFADGETGINGWNEDETSYYENGVAVKGLKEIDGSYYYFNAKGIKVVNKLVKTDGYKYYFDDDGKALIRKFKTVGDNKYYFGGEGKALRGKQTIKGQHYYFYKNSCRAADKGWVQSKTRYSLGGGKLVTGPKKIGKTVYFFNTSNAKRRTKKGFFKYNGGEYYSSSKGVLKTGFQAIKRNGKLNGYYFYKKTGKMAKDTTIGHLRIPKSGKLKKAYAYGIRKLNKNGWKLRKAYNYSAGLKYYDRWYRKKTSEQYAIRGFTEHRGNCYVMAATFYIQAKLLGYNVRQMQGKVSYRYPHSWTVIKHNGKWYVYDPCFTNEHNKNGFKIYYGKKGTWRYTNKKRMN